MNKSSSVKEIASALNAFQKGMRSIKEESENPFFKSKYADLADIWRAIREPLAQNGLSVSQGGRVVDGNATNGSMKIKVIKTAKNIKIELIIVSEVINIA